MRGFVVHEPAGSCHGRRDQQPERTSTCAWASLPDFGRAGVAPIAEARRHYLPMSVRAESEEHSSETWTSPATLVHVFVRRSTFDR
jgi:hypothetical protein